MNCALSEIGKGRVKKEKSVFRGRGCFLVGVRDLLLSRGNGRNTKRAHKWNNPRLVLLPDGVDERHANQGKKQGEEDFTRLKIGLCDRRHCGQKILAQRTSQRKQA